MSIQLSDPTYTGDLGGGLVRRWSTRSDQASIANLLSHVFRDRPDDPPNLRSADAARILMNGDFPYMGPGDFAVVEDTNRPGSPIVACTCLWRLRWRYGGISFGVGQPEMVATDAAYRKRGLARALFEMVEARSRAEGQLVLAITGIRYFYRKFGYEYTLDLEGGRHVPVAAIPERPEGKSDAISLRLATLDDIPQLMRLYDLPSAASFVWHEATEAFWRHHITSWDEPFVRQEGPTGTALYGHLHMILDHCGQIVGYTSLAAKRWTSNLVVFALQLDTGVSWQTAAPGLLRTLCAHGQQVPAVKETTKPFNAIYFNLGRSHPLFDVLRNTVPMREEPPYTWYVRVPDIPAFLRYIAPVLEARLAESIMPVYTGELKIDFYRDGLRLQFVEGNLVVAEPWHAPLYGNDANAGFPPHVFVQMIFGHRSLDELQAFLPDAWASPEAALLISVLFPKQTSVVHPLCTL